ncbi:MAG: hypothetical protein NVS2B16_31550 [Chloroflexota bacterium]
MVAYILIDRLAVTEPAALKVYQSIAAASVANHAGRYVIPHSASIEALEGNWKPSRILLIEFADAAQAKQWWNSPEYAEARAAHHAATISNVILVDGMAC